MKKSTFKNSNKSAIKKKPAFKRNYKTVTVQDVLDSATKYGDDKVLSWDILDYNDNQENGRTYDCTWVHIDFIFANGEKSILKLNFAKVMAISKAKAPQMTDNAKALQLSFKTIDIDEIKQNLKVKERSSPEKQELENTKVEKLAIDIKKNTDDFIKALEIIDKSYKAVCEEIKDAEELPYSILKNAFFKTSKDVQVLSIRSDKAKSTEKKGAFIDLPVPLYRIKLKFDVESGLIGVDSWVNKVKTFTPNVYDIKKAKIVKLPNGKVKEVPAPIATVEVDGKTRPLDKKNAGDFITHHSIHYGDINFREVIISTQGFSLDNYFEVLKVVKNTNTTREVDENINAYADMIGSDDDNDEVKPFTHKFEKIDITVNNSDESDLEDAAEINSELEDNAEVESDLDDVEESEDEVIPASKDKKTKKSK